MAPLSLFIGGQNLTKQFSPGILSPGNSVVFLLIIDTPQRVLNGPAIAGKFNNNQEKESYNGSQFRYHC